MASRSAPRPLQPDPACVAGFHANVARFLEERGVELALSAPAAAARLRAWAVALEWPPGAPPSLPPPTLYVVEQGLDEADPPVCDQCRIMGRRGRRKEGRAAVDATADPSHTHTLPRLATPPRVHRALSFYHPRPR